MEREREEKNREEDGKTTLGKKRNKSRRRR